MLTVLDEGQTWFLENLSFRNRVLTLVLIEGKAGSIPEDFRVGDTVLHGTYPIGISPESKRVQVRFRNWIAWELIDECCSHQDEYEIRDTGYLGVLEKSRYLDHVNLYHGWQDVIYGPATHYRVWTENEVIEVVGYKAPSVELIDTNAQATGCEYDGTNADGEVAIEKHRTLVPHAKSNDSRETELEGGGGSKWDSTRRLEVISGLAVLAGLIVVLSVIAWVHFSRQ